MLPNLSNYFNNSSNVVKDVKAVDPYEFITKVQSAIGNYPCTGTQYLDFNYYYNGVDTGTAVKWAVIHYGPINGIDVVNAAIASYLVSSSSYTQAQWKSIFPDIFSTTKFIVYPLWDDYAIENMSVGQSGIFKNNFRLSNLKSKALIYYTDYTDTKIDENLFYMPMPYKSIGVLVMPGEDNSSVKKSLDMMFTDIINMSSVAADFNRMKKSTQDFLILLGQCLTYGENFDVNTTLPSSLYRITRLDKTFIGFSYKGAEYIVAAKSSLP